MTTTTTTTREPGMFRAGDWILFDDGTRRLTKVIVRVDSSCTLTVRDLRWYERALAAIRMWWRDVRAAATWLRGVTGR